MKAKKAIKWICIVLAVLTAALAFIIGRSEYVKKYRITDIDASSSLSGEYQLMYQNVGEPDFPFGYAHVRLVLKKGNSEISRCRFDVANDGCSPTAEQWKAEWKDDCVEVTISGDEQSDCFYTLYFDGKTESTELETQY